MFTVAYRESGKEIFGPDTLEACTHVYLKSPWEMQILEVYPNDKRGAAAPAELSVPCPACGGEDAMYLSHDGTYWYCTECPYQRDATRF